MKISIECLLVIFLCLNKPISLQKLEMFFSIYSYSQIFLISKTEYKNYYMKFDAHLNTCLKRKIKGQYCEKKLRSPNSNMIKQNRYHWICNLITDNNQMKLPT